MCIMVNLTCEIIPKSESINSLVSSVTWNHNLSCAKQKGMYNKHPKILYTKVYDKMANANSADPDQTASFQEQSDQDLHYL